MTATGIPQAYDLGAIAPMDWEITACSLDVESTIPPELGGVYLRNGPNPAPGELDGPLPCGALGGVLGSADKLNVQGEAQTGPLQTRPRNGGMARIVALGQVIDVLARATSSGRYTMCCAPWSAPLAATSRSMAVDPISVVGWRIDDSGTTADCAKSMSS
jgi:hypothetical protein